MSKYHKKSLMRPITIKHDKPVTDICYNLDGDLMFSCDKSGSVSVWNADNGERLGTYERYDEKSKACYSVDVDGPSKRLLVGYADQRAILWNVESGEQIYEFKENVGVRCVKFSLGDKMFLSVTDSVMGLTAGVNVYKLSEDERDQTDYPLLMIKEETRQKIFRALWGYNNETILTCNEDGCVKIFDTEQNGQLIKTIKAHTEPIPFIKSDKYNLTIITASKDGYAKLIDTRTYKIVREYEVGRPINCAAISPIMDHIIMGGGERAEKVTTSGATSQQFQVRFYHTIFGNELGSVLGHFGPVNTLAFHPNGRSFASGGEDGYVRIRHFPPSYFERTQDKRKYPMA